MLQSSRSGWWVLKNSIIKCSLFPIDCGLLEGAVTSTPTKPTVDELHPVELISKQTVYWLLLVYS